MFSFLNKNPFFEIIIVYIILLILIKQKKLKVQGMCNDTVHHVTIFRDWYDSTHLIMDKQKFLTYCVCHESRYQSTIYHANWPMEDFGCCYYYFVMCECYHLPCPCLPKSETYPTVWHYNVSLTLIWNSQSCQHVNRLPIF